MPPQKSGPLTGAENERDFCRYLGLFTTVGHDGDAPQIALGRQTCARVEQVMPQRVALPPVAMSNAGSGDGAVAQRDCPELVPSWHGDRPLLSNRRESQDSEV